MNTENKKFESMLNNWINGNIFDYSQQLRSLSKIRLLEYLQYVKNYSGYSMENTISRIISLLEN